MLRLAKELLAKLTVVACTSEPKCHLNRMRSKANSPVEPVHRLSELPRKSVEVDLIADVENGSQFDFGCASKQANKGAANVGQPLQIGFERVA